ncbi:MAG: hypothetical protein U0166_00565 [Acidobacteriota bacterium]
MQTAVVALPGNEAGIEAPGRAVAMDRPAARLPLGAEALDVGLLTIITGREANAVKLLAGAGSSGISLGLTSSLSRGAPLSAVRRGSWPRWSSGRAVAPPAPRPRIEVPSRRRRYSPMYQHKDREHFEITCSRPGTTSSRTAWSRSAP